MMHNFVLPTLESLAIFVLISLVNTLSCSQPFNLLFIRSWVVNHRWQSREKRKKRIKKNLKMKSRSSCFNQRIFFWWKISFAKQKKKKLCCWLLQSCFCKVNMSLQKMHHFFFLSQELVYFWENFALVYDAIEYWKWWQRTETFQFPI